MDNISFFGFIVLRSAFNWEPNFIFGADLAVGLFCAVLFEHKQNESDPWWLAFWAARLFIYRLRE